MIFNTPPITKKNSKRNTPPNPIKDSTLEDYIVTYMNLKLSEISTEIIFGIMMGRICIATFKTTKTDKKELNLSSNFRSNCMLYQIGQFVNPP